MTRTVTGTATLQPATGPATPPPDHYLLTLTNTVTGQVITGTAPMGSTSIVIDNVPQGTYSSTYLCVTADGTPWSTAVAADNLSVSDPVATVTVDVPATLVLSVA
jgi:hypothetical protein